MIDFKAPLRTAYYQLLLNKLLVGGVFVPVSEGIEKLNELGNVYVLLAQQTGSSDNTQQSSDSNETIALDIITRGTRVSKLTVDLIAAQIFALLFPYPGSPNLAYLPAQPGVSIINVRVTDDRNMAFQITGGVNVSRRLIVLTQFVSQS